MITKLAGVGARDQLTQLCWTDSDLTGARRPNRPILDETVIPTYVNSDLSALNPNERRFHLDCGGRPL